MIEVEIVLDFHNRLIEKYGGVNGVRDEGSLLSALASPYMTFDQEDLYPTPVHKAAALLESIVINHPFIDGNKRTAYTFAKFLLFKIALLLLQISPKNIKW